MPQVFWLALHRPVSLSSLMHGTKSLDNPHEFLPERSLGAGKSYFYKIRIMRELLLASQTGTARCGHRPDGEYAPLCLALGGNYLRLAPGSDQHLNPLTSFLSRSICKTTSAIAVVAIASPTRVQVLHALFDIMLSDRTPSGANDTHRTRKRPAGPGHLRNLQPGRHYRRSAYPQPSGSLMQDLYQVLTDGICGRDEFGLADRLHRYVGQSLRDLPISDRYRARQPSGGF